MDFLAPFEILDKCWGEVAPNWSAGEDLNKLHIYDQDFPRELAVKLHVEELIPLVDVFGDALTFQFLLGELPVFDLREGTIEDGLEQLSVETEGSPTITFIFMLDKRILVDRLFEQTFANLPEPIQLYLFLFPQRFEEYLSRASLSQIEDQLWNGRCNEKVVLLVPNRDVCLSGPILSVLGGQYIENMPDGLLTQLSADIGGWETINQRAQDNLKWQQPWVKQLTPWHLVCKNLSGEIEGIGKLLRVHFLNCSLLFTGDRTILQTKDGNREKFISSFNGSQQAIEIEWQIPSPVLPNGITNSQFNCILEILEWTYDARWATRDRLSFVQISLVDVLRGSPLEKRYYMFVENAETIISNIDWHWKAFTEGKIGAYVEQFQELEKYVSETVHAHTELTSGMIKGLTDTMLAAVGVCVGSFVLALFQSPFNSTVFQVGLFIYAIYIIIFPLLFGLSAQEENYSLLLKNFGQRKKWFQERLPIDHVNRIISESGIEECNHQFKKKHHRVRNIYALSAVIIFSAGIVIPNLYKNQVDLFIGGSTLDPQITPSSTVVLSEEAPVLIHSTVVAPSDHSSIKQTTPEPLGSSTP